jgi:hypothetical protein
MAIILKKQHKIQNRKPTLLAEDKLRYMEVLYTETYAQFIINGEKENYRLEIPLELLRTMLEESSRKSKKTLIYI